MSQNKMMYTYEELLDQIKHCGQSIIDNAENILGNERYFTGVTVTFDIFRDADSIPEIEIKRKFIPELQIEKDNKMIFDKEENHIPNLY